MFFFVFCLYCRVPDDRDTFCTQTKCRDRLPVTHLAVNHQSDHNRGQTGSHLPCPPVRLERNVQLTNEPVTPVTIQFLHSRWVY